MGELMRRYWQPVCTSPQDVTLQELRIESFFPIHDDTAEIFRAWAPR
jgi:hypothetical protein